MRRTYRTGAAVAATAALLTGGGFAFASLRDPVTGAPAKVADVVPATTSTVGPEDVEAALAELRGEAADLRAEIAARKNARKAAARDEPTPTATTSRAAKAPTTDATTGASGAGGDEDEDEENGDDD